MHALDLVVVGEVVGDVAPALALAALLHHLDDLRLDRFFPSRRIPLGVQLPGPLRLLALSLLGRQPGLIDALGAGLAFHLLLNALVLLGLVDLLLVDQAGFQKLILQRGHGLLRVNKGLVRARDGRKHSKASGGGCGRRGG